MTAADLFHWTMVRIHQLGPKGFRAVLWHQGESDCAGETTDSYMEKLTRVIRAAHARLWELGVALEGPDTDTLVGDDRDYDGRGIHFSPKGLKRHGEMWAEKVIPWLDEQLER